jgi:hypothetical protein
MVHRFLVSCSFICCTLVIASFAFFAVDQFAGASNQQVAQLDSGSPAPATKATKTRHGAVRRFVDQAARDLTYPFHSLAESSSQWANQILVLVIALAVYGVGLGYLARYASGLP